MGEPLDLERDLPTTARDVVCLRQARAPRQLALADYLCFLRGFASPPAHVLRARCVPDGPPFDLCR